MKTAIPRIKLIFLAVFAVACVAVWVLQVFYVWPRNRCEARGNWWDSQTRVCATPIFLPNITGRPLGSTPLKGVAQESRVNPGVQSTSPAP